MMEYSTLVSSTATLTRRTYAEDAALNAYVGRLAEHGFREGVAAAEEACLI
jgi:hypothetical protein